MCTVRVMGVQMVFFIGLEEVENFDVRLKCDEHRLGRGYTAPVDKLKRRLCIAIV